MEGCAGRGPSHLLMTPQFHAFKTAERDGWSDRAAAYQDHTGLATLQIAPALLDAVGARPGLRALETACGTANIAAALAALGCDTVGVDFSDGMIDVARAQFPDLDLRVADAQDLPLDDSHFDIAICNMGLFHMTKPDTAMAEAARVLRQGGRFAWSQWTAPADSVLYGTLFDILKSDADMSRADPAPDAYVLSDPDHATEMMQVAGFCDIHVRRLPTTLIATGDDFFDFFMKFGVRVPLIVAAQDPDVQTILRTRINAAMAPWRTPAGWEVPMPSLVISGTVQ